MLHPTTHPSSTVRTIPEHSRVLAYLRVKEQVRQAWMEGGCGTASASRGARGCGRALHEWRCCGGCRDVVIGSWMRGSVWELDEGFCVSGT
eukprot:1633998-Rhodomonas_salina.2